MRPNDAPLQLGAFIRESPYFDYHFLAGDARRFCRAPTRWRWKHYAGIPVPYPTRLYTAIKFGVVDTLGYELQAFQRLGSLLGDYLPKNAHLAWVGGRRALVADWPVDFDGRPAPMICQHGPVFEESFWNHVDAVADRLRHAAVPLQGVFTRDTAAVLVHRASEVETRPVIVDLLKSGRRFYHYQFWNHAPGQWRKKFERRLIEFRRRYQPDFLQANPHSRADLRRMPGPAGETPVRRPAEAVVASGMGSI